MACAVFASAQAPANPAPTPASANPAPADQSQAKIRKLQDAIRRRDASALPDLGAESDPEVRAWILRAAARTAAQTAWTTLEGGLQDPDARVRLAAVEELGQKGGARAVADLAGALAGEKSPGVRQAIVFWLGAWPDAKAQAALAQAVASDADANVRAEAAQALKRRGTNEAKKALKKAVQDPDDRVRKLTNE